MSCPNCGEAQFIAREYKMASGQALALECAKCHVLRLDEEAVDSAEDREAVRMAVAKRAHARASAASQQPFEFAPLREWQPKLRRIRSGTYEALHAPSQAELEIERALTDLTVCLEHLGQLTTGESQRAVTDAQSALERVQEKLRNRSASVEHWAANETRAAS